MVLLGAKMEVEVRQQIQLNQQTFLVLEVAAVLMLPEAMDQIIHPMEQMREVAVAVTE